MCIQCWPQVGVWSLEIQLPVALVQDVRHPPHVYNINTCLMVLLQVTGMLSVLLVVQLLSWSSGQ